MFYQDNPVFTGLFLDIASLYFSQACIGKLSVSARRCFCFSFWCWLSFTMPGDPAVLDKRAKGLILTAPVLLHSVAVKLPPFWPDNIETSFLQL